MTSLPGRTIALIGLDSEQLLAASAAIEAAGGDWQAFGRAPDPAKLRGSDAIVCSAALAPELAKAGLPLLVVGHAELDVPHDFLLRRGVHLRPRSRWCWRRTTIRPPPRSCARS
jgi:hypothetical protein